MTPLTRHNSPSTPCQDNRRVHGASITYHEGHTATPQWTPALGMKIMRVTKATALYKGVVNVNGRACGCPTKARCYVTELALLRRTH